MSKQMKNEYKMEEKANDFVMCNKCWYSFLFY